MIEMTAPIATGSQQTEQAAQFVGTNGDDRADRRRAALDALKAAQKPAKATPAPQAAPEPRQEAEETEDDGEPVDEAPALLRGAEAQQEATEEDEDDAPKLAAVVRAREKANRLRREAEAQRMEIERERMRLDMERRELEQLKRAREAMARDPLAGLKELGVDVRDLTERAALEGTPEAQLRELREALEAQRKELEDYRRGQTAREMEQTRAKAEAEFFGMAKQEEQFPFLAARAELHPELVKAQAYQLQEQYYKQTGKVPSLQEIAEALDYLASEEYRHVSEREARRGASTAAAPGNGPAAGKPRTSRTLSTARAGEKSTAAPDLRGMNRDARKEYVAQLFKAGRLGG
jgi:hypothetical protein